MSHHANPKENRIRSRQASRTQAVQRRTDPLKATPFAAHAAKKSSKKLGGITVTTMNRARPV